MHNLPVHWHEGLFLRPHHLQAAERWYGETLTTSERYDHTYNYGVSRLEINEEAVANGQFQIDACHARMRDGTLVCLDPGHGLDRVDLSEPFEKQETVRAFLAIPRLKMGHPNVCTDGPAAKHRYVEIRRPVEDESRGGDEQELALRTLNVRVILSTDDQEGYELLPLAQIARAGQQEATPRIDTDYIPPVLAIDAWPPLGRDVVRKLYDYIGQRIRGLSEQVISRGISLASQQPGDMDRVFMLAQLNAAYARLEVLTFSQGIHPLTAYTELCGLVGQLSIFSETRRPPDIPRYDHDDLAKIFYWVRDQIHLLTQVIRDYVYEQRFFVGEGNGMRVKLESYWLSPDWHWFVGVKRRTLSAKDCHALLSGKLDWKLGSARQVDYLYETGSEGLQITPLPQAPAALPVSGDWLYYEVVKRNTAWQDVLETETLAMRLNEALITNKDDLQGQTTLVIGCEGRQMPLQFALFAVPSSP